MFYDNWDLGDWAKAAVATTVGGPMGFGAAVLGNNAAKDNAPKPYQDPSQGPGPNGGWNPWSFPADGPPKYKNTYNPSMATAGSLSNDLNNAAGFKRLQQDALRSGPSTWANLAQQNQQMQATTAKNTATMDAAGQAANARSQLAMRGGLASGARERIAKTGARNLMDMNQQIGANLADNSMKIGMQDEQNRQGMLGKLNAAEMDRARMNQGAREFDVRNQMADAAGQNNYNMGMFNTQMQGWAAGQQANLNDRRNPASPYYDDGKRWYNPFSW